MPAGSGERDGAALGPLPAALAQDGGAQALLGEREGDLLLVEEVLAGRADGLAQEVRGAGGLGGGERVLHPHFVREEQIALPPLALLRPLSEGKFEPAMRAVLPMTDSLRGELPRMLREHGEIGAAARRLEQVAREEGNTAVERLAQKLQLHARSEEELFYPAAVLVGDLVRARAGSSP